MYSMHGSDLYKHTTVICCACSVGRRHAAHVADGPVRAAGGRAAVAPADPADGDAGSADCCTAGWRLEGAGFVRQIVALACCHEASEPSFRTPFDVFSQAVSSCSEVSDSESYPYSMACLADEPEGLTLTVEILKQLPAARLHARQAAWLPKQPVG